jgi:hypothetical protein
MSSVTSPSIKHEYSEGNHRAVVAVIGSIGTGNTWTVPLKSITSVIIENSTGGATHGYSASGNVITFRCSATMANAVVKVTGY